MNNTLKNFLACGIVLLLCFYTIIFIESKRKTQKVNIPTYINYYKYGITTDDFIILCDTIAKYEGLMCIPYKYNDHFYIGYGHQIKSNEVITKVDSILAREILYKDVDIALNEAFRVTHLTGNKLLAISDFIFNYGTFKFINSSLYSALLSNSSDTLKIKSELLKWNKIDGKTHPKLLQRRNFNYWLYIK